MSVPTLTYAQAIAPTPAPGLTGETDPLNRTVQLAALLATSGALTGAFGATVGKDWANLVVPLLGLPTETLMVRLCAIGAAIATAHGPAVGYGEGLYGLSPYGG